MDISYQRLHNQQLSIPGFTKPEDVVSWLGAVQAQDYAGAKWALGQRMKGATDDTIERAFASGSILRTHVMRLTWHFVSPADIRWMLKLTAPRVNAAMSHYNRKFGLDQVLFKRSNKALAAALKGGNQLTRDQLRHAVRLRAGIQTDDSIRFAHILMHAELDAVICSGARKGKQFTYALFEERVPPTKSLKREEALAELALRYFTSHGPATLQDFVWWSGLTTTDARAGIQMIQSQIVQEMIDRKPYWFPRSIRSQKQASAYLLPAYDEYLVAYRDRSASMDPEHNKQADRNNILFNPTIVIRGRVVGTWKFTHQKSATNITLLPFAPLSHADKQLIGNAEHHYRKFLEP